MPRGCYHRNSPLPEPVALPPQGGAHRPLLLHDHGLLGDSADAVQTSTVVSLNERCRRQPPLQGSPLDEPLPEPLATTPYQRFGAALFWLTLAGCTVLAFFTWRR